MAQLAAKQDSRDAGMTSHFGPPTQRKKHVIIKVNKPRVFIEAYKAYFV